MKKVYIIDEYISSTKNGIGRYVGELTTALVTLKIDTNIIVLNSESSKVEVKKEKEVESIYIPHSSNYYVSNSFVLGCILKLHISDATENVFIVNHSPCKPLIETLKKYFPLSQIVFVIHDLSWTTPLLGNEKLFEEIMQNRKREDSNIKSKYGIELKKIDSVKDFLRICNKIICLSPSTKKLLENYYDIPKNQIVLLPNFLSDRNTYLSEDIKIKIKKKYNVENNKIILAVGRLTAPKGSLPLITAFRGVLEKYPDALLVFAGGLLQSEEITKAYQKVCNRVIFLGHIPFTELLEWYQIADIGAVPSYTEQCSYAGIEMLMSGLPIVASDGFGVRDMFKNSLNAIIAKIEDYNDSSAYERNLTNAIIEILDDRSLQENLRQVSRKTYEEKYSMKRGIEHIRQFLI